MIAVRKNILNDKYISVELVVDEFSFSDKVETASVSFEVQEESASMAIVLHDKQGDNIGQSNEDLTVPQLKEIRKQLKKMIRELES